MCAKDLQNVIWCVLFMLVGFLLISLWLLILVYVEG